MDPDQPKKKSKKWLIIIIVVLLLAIIALFFLSKKTFSGLTSGDGYAGVLSLPENFVLDSERGVESTFGPAGGVLSVKASDGTLYTLTVPPESLIVPRKVTLTPLKTIPFNNYARAELGSGVFVGENVSFNRPAYLTIQPKDTVGKSSTKPLDWWGRCAIGSRGYDPEICAGIKKIPLSVGIDPGKVVIYGTKEFDQILLNPTIPTDAPDTYNTMVWRYGAYMADTINATEAKQLVDLTYANGNDTVNLAEPMLHLAALGGDIQVYKKEIADLAREKRDYPRETIKQMILADMVEDETTYQTRLEAIKSLYKKTIDNPKASFLPLPRYTALIRQLKANEKTKTGINFWGIRTAKAIELPDYDPNANNNESNPGDDLPDYVPPPDELPDYDPNKYADDDGPMTWPELPDYDPNNNDRNDQDNHNPPELPDYVDDSADRANRDGDDATSDTWGSGGDVSSRTQACNALLDGLEALSYYGVLASNIEEIRRLLNDCADNCTTFEDCERYGDAGARYGATNAYYAAINRIKKFLSAGGDCDDAVKKDLSTYGIQCQ